jgi:hypothetical protein
VTTDSAAANAAIGAATTPATPVRATQSFVATIGQCWRNPRLLLIEVAWRWAIGIPLCALFAWETFRNLSQVSLAGTGISHFSLIDSLAAAQTVAEVGDRLIPPVLRALLWIGPLSAALWSLASGFGRSRVLRRLDPALPSRPWMLAILQFVRIAALAASAALWFVLLRWAAQSSLGGAAPNLVTYSVKAIALSFAVFFAWAAISWVFSIAPLLVLVEGCGIAAAFRNSVQFGKGRLAGLRSQMVEVNLVLAIIKVALIVMAMVCCATPVPFREEMTGNALYFWWILVSILYLVASDFFQVARLAGYIELWRSRNARSPVPEPRPALPAIN